jgi:hypothetical protein
MKKQIILIISTFIYVTIIIVTYIFNFEKADAKDCFASIALIDILVVLNYGFRVRFLKHDLYSDYSKLILTQKPVSKILQEEGVAYILAPANILFFILSALFVCWIFNSFNLWLFFSCIFHFVVLTTWLLLLRYLIGHDKSGKNNFFVSLLSINTFFIFQYILIYNDSSGFIEKLFLDYCLLNNIYFLIETTNISWYYAFIPHFGTIILLLVSIVKLKWRRNYLQCLQ